MIKFFMKMGVTQVFKWPVGLTINTCLTEGGKKIQGGK